MVYEFYLNIKIYIFFNILHVTDKNFLLKAPLERRMGSHIEGCTEHVFVPPLTSQIFIHST